MGTFTVSWQTGTGLGFVLRTAYDSASADYESDAMVKLEKPLRREIRIKNQAHVLTIDPAGFKLTRKGRRKGIQIAWKDLASGDAALAAALNASLGKL
jgi:hypothetical protein